MDESIWLLISGILFVVFFSLFYRFRYRPSMKGDARDINGRSYFLQISRHKGHVTGFKVTLENINVPEFFLCNKTAFHRFFDRIQNSSRMTFEQDSFPPSLKLITDNMAVRQSFIGNGLLRNTAQNILQDGKFSFGKIVSLRSYNGLLMAEFRRKGDIDEGMINNAAEQLAPSLFTVQDALQHVEPKKDPGLPKAKLVQSISAAIGILFFFLVIKLFAFGDLFQVQLFHFVAICTGVGFVVSLILTFLIYRVFIESSHFYRVLTEFISFGWIGIILSTIMIMNFVNMEYDNQKAKRTEAVIINTYETVRKNKRGNKTYRFFAKLDNSQNPAEVPDEIQINRAEFIAAKNGDKVILHVKPGYLDFAWIEKFEILSPTW